MEETPEAFVEQLVAVFREVKRVLRDDGTLWLNLGDSYASFRDNKCTPQTLDGEQRAMPTQGASTIGRAAFAGGPIKHKDLVGIPWRVAFALQADGWYLRQDIIWSKPGPMPESVTDRCTKAHEYIFLLSKAPRYYYDADAIREPLADKTYTTFGTQHRPQGNDALGKVKSDNWGRTVDERQPKRLANGNIAGANKRSVWTVTTKPFKGAHFATFPPDLIEPCIKAGCPPQGTILDPFGGAGTTGLVADRLNRNAILCELNPEYAKIAEERLQDDNPMFTQVEVVQ